MLFEGIYLGTRSLAWVVIVVKLGERHLHVLSDVVLCHLYNFSMTKISIP